MRTTTAPGQKAGGASDVVARLISLAGTRPNPGVSIEESVRAAVHGAWRAELARRSRARNRRHWLAAGVAACAVVLGWTVMHGGGGQAPQLPAATIVGTRGPVHVTPLPGHALLVAGDSLAAGTRIETEAGGAVLLAVGHASVRVDADTALGLERAGQLHLLRGRLYVDSGAAPATEPLLLVTEFGSLTHLGTQYQVEVNPGRYLYTSVREGRVQLQAFGRNQIIGRGEGLRVSGADAITRLAVPPFDPQWQWVSDFLPAFSIEGQSLSVFLNWFARETGRTLTFRSPADRMAAEHTTLNGSISGLTPLQALDAVVATTRFQCDLSVAGEIRVGVRGAGDAKIDGNAKPSAATGPPSY